MDRPEQTLSAVLDAGELLLTSGAEAARVEDTMRRLARAYGFVRADVLTITASMALTDDEYTLCYKHGMPDTDRLPRLVLNQAHSGH